MGSLGSKNKLNDERCGSRSVTLSDERCGSCSQIALLSKVPLFVDGGVGAWFRTVSRVLIATVVAVSHKFEASRLRLMLSAILPHLVEVYVKNERAAFFSAPREAKSLMCTRR